MKNCCRLLLFCFGLVPGLSAQDLDSLYLARRVAVFQESPDTLVPVQTRIDGWYSWYAEVGISFRTGAATLLQISGPIFPVGQDLLKRGNSSNEYFRAFGFESAADLLANIPAGTYSFSGVGNTVGFFSEPLEVVAADLLTPRRITNFPSLQAVNPSQPIRVEWEPFTEANGKPAFIQVSVRQYVDGDGQEYYHSDSVEGYFGLPPETTFVEIPPDRLLGNPSLPYELVLSIGRIEAITDVTGFGSGIKGTISYTETVAYIHETPTRLTLPLGDWVEDPTLGWIYGLTEDWGYSPDLGYIWVGYTPVSLYQQNLGWLTPVSGTLKTGIWFHSVAADWIYTSVGLRGWYVNSADSWGNMIAP